jgi:type IX secretion system PorP/SprF family membrane protein
MRILYITTFLFFIGNIAFAQHDRLYTMFVFNKLQYNPAYAGNAGALNIGAHYRHQWQGFEGAPKTVTAFAHTPLDKDRGGLGLSIISDEIGLLNSTYTKLDYAYRIAFKNETKLSVGLTGEIDFTRFDWSKADLIDNFDAVIPFGQASNTSFNVGTGIYFEGNKFYVGYSMPRLLRNAITSEAYKGFGEINGFRPHYLMGGLIFKAGPKVHIRPSLLMTYIANAPFELDFNLSVLFLESFWIGGSYRLGESADAFVQFPVSKQLKVAVGLDYSLSEINTFTRGSFEVMVEYLFKFDNEKINNIRFF